MIYYPSKSSVPNREKLSTMTAEQASNWAAGMGLAEGILTECMEVHRRAQVETFFGLTREQEEKLHWAAVQRVCAVAA